jgi:hypothetical protein
MTDHSQLRWTKFQSFVGVLALLVGAGTYKLTADQLAIARAAAPTTSNSVSEGRSDSAPVPAPEQSAPTQQEPEQSAPVQQEAQPPIASSPPTAGQVTAESAQRQSPSADSEPSSQIERPSPAAHGARHSTRSLADERPAVEMPRSAPYRGEQRAETTTALGIPIEFKHEAQ